MPTCPWSSSEPWQPTPGSNADLRAVQEVLHANDPGQLRLRTPALIVQGNDDPIVARSRTDHLVSSIRAKAVVDYRIYNGRVIST